MVFRNPELRAKKISESSMGKKCPWAKNNPQVFKKGFAPWNKGLVGVQSGENSPRWKGGVSKGYKTGYYSAQYKQWRRDVFIIDEFTCK